MGGCCCCASRRRDSDRAPIYYYCPEDLDEEEINSSAHVTNSAILVDTNLDTSTPDTYRAPPTPLPYETDATRPRSISTDHDNCTSKSGQLQQMHSESMEEMLDTASVLKGSELKDVSLEDDTTKGQEKTELVDTLTIDEEDCPICLEEYDSENPRITTKCEHDFHLSCILEWMERSDTCPLCEQIIVFSQGIHNNTEEIDTI